MGREERQFAHATLAEIYQQPRALADTLASYALGTDPPAEVWQMITSFPASQRNLVIAASGSSRHAGLLGEIFLEELSNIAVDVEYASEFVYRRRDPVSHPAVLVISQSGETADTLAALREAKRRGEQTLSITNVADSSMQREADVSLLTGAGKEVAIAATKSFVTQVSLLYLLALALGRERQVLAPERLSKMVAELERLPALLDEYLEGWESEMILIAQTFSLAEAFLFVGRGPHYPIAREAALKLKEMSYLHAEAYPSGELKHGPNALLGPGSPLIVLATKDEEDPMSKIRYEKSVQLLTDIQKQGSQILAVINEGDTIVPNLCDSYVSVPPASEYCLPILEIVPLQLFAYFMSVQRGNNVDRPRNLVKAVVVE